MLPILAFSFGTRPDVNFELAWIVEAAIEKKPDVRAFAQWEIAHILYQRDTSFRERVRRIDLDYGRDYMTTTQRVGKFMRFAGDGAVSLFVVAQAWHCPRCVASCRAPELRLNEQQAVNVVGWDVVDLFSPRDLQKWVRNAFAWVLKEGTR